MIVDSSVWLEIFSKGPRATECQLKMRGHTVSIPVIVLYEVYRKVKQKTSDETGLEVVAGLSKFKILPLERELALLAADLSLEHALSMADSLIYAFAIEHDEPLLTLDHDFSKLPGVIVIH